MTISHQIELRVPCPVCHNCYEGMFCHRCATQKRMVEQGLRWCRLVPISSATLSDTHSVLAMIGDLHLSHYGRGYWVVAGRVPLAIANELYADPVGRDLIRVDGHCGCPAPVAPWVSWYLENGKRVLGLTDRTQCKEYLAGQFGVLVKIATEILATCEFSDDPASIGAAGFVESYHIDGDLGLRVFVDTLIRHGLYTIPVKS